MRRALGDDEAPTTDGGFRLPQPTNTLRIRSLTARAEMEHSIPGCKWRMRLCGARRSHFSRAKFIPKPSYDRRKIAAQNPALRTELFKNRKWKVTSSTS